MNWPGCIEQQHLHQLISICHHTESSSSQISGKWLSHSLHKAQGHLFAGKIPYGIKCNIQTGYDTGLIFKRDMTLA